MKLKKETIEAIAVMASGHNGETLSERVAWTKEFFSNNYNNILDLFEKRDLEKEYDIKLSYSKLAEIVAEMVCDNGPDQSNCYRILETVIAENKDNQQLVKVLTTVKKYIGEISKRRAVMIKSRWLK